MAKIHPEFTQGSYSGSWSSRIHVSSQECTMSEQKHVRLELTEEQKAQVKAATGKDAGAIELNAEELEERIAPLNVRLKG